MKILSLRFSRACHSYEEWAIPQRQSADRLRRIERVEGKVLDLGCGTGLMSEGLEDVVGVDIALGMAKVYHDKYGKVVLARAEELPFKDRSFDCVVSNFSLHWTDLERSLSEAIRVCRKTLLCAMPVEGSLPQMGFPFPEEKWVKEFLKGKVRIRSFFIEKLSIPFRGWDLVRFFHHTGSSYNPVYGGGIISKKRIENMINTIDNPLFRVLFFSCEVT